MKRSAALLLTLLVASSTLLEAEFAYPQRTSHSFTRTFPYSLVGQLEFDSGRRTYIGTGTVIRAKSVLTAAHNLYDVNKGWSTDILFRRGQHGDEAISESRPNRLFVLGGYQSKVAYYGGDSVRALANDTGGLRFSTPVANGAYAGWSTDLSLLTSGAYNVALGYGAEFGHSGDDLLYVEATESFYRTFGAFYENESIYVERGMSGGPVFAIDDDGELYLCATIVASADDPIAGGIRVFDRKVADLIRNYLR